MFGNRRKPKSFEYIPRFYDPAKDPEEKKKKRLGFRSVIRETKSRRRINPYFTIILLIILFLIYMQLSKLSN